MKIKKWNKVESHNKHFFKENFLEKNVILRLLALQMRLTAAPDCTGKTWINSFNFTLNYFINTIFNFNLFCLAKEEKLVKFKYVQKNSKKIFGWGGGGVFFLFLGGLRPGVTPAKKIA